MFLTSVTVFYCEPRRVETISVTSCSGTSSSEESPDKTSKAQSDSEGTTNYNDSDSSNAPNTPIDNNEIIRRLIKLYRKGRMSYRCLKDVNHIFIAAGHHILVDPR